MVEVLKKWDRTVNFNLLLFIKLIVIRRFLLRSLFKLTLNVIMSKIFIFLRMPRFYCFHDYVPFFSTKATLVRVNIFLQTLSAWSCINLGNGESIFYILFYLKFKIFGSYSHAVIIINSSFHFQQLHRILGCHLYVCLEWSKSSLIFFCFIWGVHLYSAEKFSSGI